MSGYFSRRFPFIRIFGSVESILLYHTKKRMNFIENAK